MNSGLNEPKSVTARIAEFISGVAIADVPIKVRETAKLHLIDGLAAYIAGVEVACRLGDGVSPSHYLDGFHPTGTFGTFGAAAACSHLLRLDKEHCAWAIGIAGTLASGVRANRGTMTKSLNAGRA